MSRCGRVQHRGVDRERILPVLGGLVDKGAPEPLGVGQSVVASFSTNRSCSVGAGEKNYQLMALRRA